jgi:hypothetical protein
MPGIESFREEERKATPLGKRRCGDRRYFRNGVRMPRLVLRDLLNDCLDGPETLDLGFGGDDVAVAHDGTMSTVSRIFSFDYKRRWLTDKGNPAMFRRVAPYGCR